MNRSIMLMFVVVMAAGAHAKAQSIVKIDGSSTVFPVTEAVSEEFQTAQKGKVRVTVGVSGTGGGFKKFCRGETDLQDASRPIQASEMEDCKKAGVRYIELPIAYDATVVVVNPKNTWLKEINIDDLKKIWEPSAQGKITKWKQVNPAWPNEDIKLFGPGADSGTFDYFTEAVVGKAKSSRGDYTATQDHNTSVTGIANEKSALGYIPLSYYEENKAKLKVLGVIGGEKSPLKNKAVLPSKDTVENGQYFPLSRPIFIYVKEDALKRPEVAAYAKFYIENAGRLASQVKYISLPAKAYTMAGEHLAKKKLGTVFGGYSEVGLKIDELMKREAKE
jgi:phosphate transport system substrate-binding protein